VNPDYSKLEPRLARAHDAWKLLRAADYAPPVYGPIPDWYALRAAEWGCTRAEAKRRYIAAAYGGGRGLER
jgi:hypothetical protein